ncbi:MAG: glycosyl transferase [Williamsia sp.]|nr:glycosyl transferase [Williamsia sp.]
MRVLYAIQGTGNGHISRARDIVPLLHRKADLDLVISGSQAEVALPYPVKYRFKGLGFVFGKKGGVDLLETYKKSRLRRLLEEISHLPVEDYDLVISDFEPVSSWACYIRNKPCISLSHQAAVLNKKAPQPAHTDLAGKAILKYYAPASHHYGFHFGAYDKDIFTPVIRRQVRELEPVNQGHYTVYLPAYDDERILKVLRECKGVQWQVFSKHNKKAFTEANVSVYPVSNESFLESMARSAGVLCGAGFETPAEALHMGKKLLVIPMKNQYEQHCNAAALQSMGVPVIKSLKKKHTDKINAWLRSDKRIAVDYPDTTAQIIDHVLESHALSGGATTGSLQKRDHSLKELRKLSLQKMLAYIAG